MHFQNKYITNAAALVGLFNAPKGCNGLYTITSFLKALTGRIPN